MLEHGFSSIRVSGVPLDLRPAAPDDAHPVVLFSYTDQAGYQDYLRLAREGAAAPELLSRLARSGRPQQTPLFGRGAYFTRKEPNDFASKQAVLWNNHWPSQKELDDEEKQQSPDAVRPTRSFMSRVATSNPAERSLKGPQSHRNSALCDRVAQDFAGMADYCVPVLAPPSLACWLWQRPSQDLARLGVGPGCNCFGEKQWDGRDIWVVRLPMEESLPAQIEEAKRKAELLTRVRGDAHPETQAAFGRLAELLEADGRAGEAELLLRHVLERQSEHGAERPAASHAKIRLGAMLARTERYRDAEDLLQQARHALEKVLGKTHADTQEASWQLAQLLLVAGRMSDAREIMEALLGSLEEKHGDGVHRDVLQTRLRRAKVLKEMGDLQEALVELRRTERDSRSCSDEDITVEAMSLLAVLLEKDGHFAECERLYNRLVKDLTQLKGESDPFTMAALNNYAVFLNTIGRHDEAEQHLRASLETRGWVSREQPGALDEPKLTSLSNLGSLLEAMGKYNEAEPLQRFVLEMREMSGREHGSTLESCNNLAVLLQRRGKHREAEQLYRRALEGHLRTKGERSLASGMSLHNLGELLLEEGSVQEAEALLQRALESRMRTLGPTACETLRTQDSLARLWRRTGRSAKADEPLRLAAQRCQRDLGPTHELTLMSLNHLAIHLQAAGQHEEAIETLRHSAEACRSYAEESREGNNDRVIQPSAAAGLPTVAGPRQLEALNNLALLLREAGDYRGAEPLLRDVVEGRRRLCGPNHQSTLTAVNNLGVLLQDTGNYSEAEPLQREALRSRKETLGHEHPETLTALNNLATVFKAMGLHDKAVETHRLALQGKQSSLGPTHPSTLKTLDNLVDLLSSTGRGSEAEHLQRSAVLDQEHALGPEHADTIASRVKLAALLMAAPQEHLPDPNAGCRGKREEAEFHLRRALQVRERTLGPEHPEALEAAGRLAELWLASGKYELAEPLQRRSLQHLVRALGRTHPDTMPARSNLAVLLHMRGKFTEAEALHVEVLRDCRQRLGRTDERTLSVCEDLASLMSAVSRHAEAEGLRREIFEARKASQGEWHQQTLLAEHELGTALQQLPDKREEAIRHLYRAWQGRMETLGQAHEVTLCSLSQLTQLLRSLGPSRFEDTETERFFYHLWSTRKEAKGARHPSTLIALTQLATVCWHLGKYGHAEQHFRTVLQLRRAIGESHEAIGPGHAAEVATALSLARVLQKRGQIIKKLEDDNEEEAEELFQEAEKLFEEVLAYREAKLGSGHCNVLAAREEFERLRQRRNGAGSCFCIAGDVAGIEEFAKESNGN